VSVPCSTTARQGIKPITLAVSVPCSTRGSLLGGPEWCPAPVREMIDSLLLISHHSHQKRLVVNINTSLQSRLTSSLCGCFSARPRARTAVGSVSPGGSVECISGRECGVYLRVGVWSVSPGGSVECISGRECISGCEWECISGRECVDALIDHRQGGGSGGPLSGVVMAVRGLVNQIKALYEMTSSWPRPPVRRLPGSSAADIRSHVLNTTAVVRTACLPVSPSPTSCLTSCPV